jgi:hypothetical protein
LETGGGGQEWQGLQAVEPELLVDAGRTLDHVHIQLAAALSAVKRDLLQINAEMGALEL